MLNMKKFKKSDKISTRISDALSAYCYECIQDKEF